MVVRTVVLLMLAVLFGAVGAATPLAAQDVRVVNFWMNWGPGNSINQAFQQLADRFNQNHPDIHVNVEGVAGYYEKLPVAFAVGDPPDALILADPRMFAEDGLLLDFETLAARDNVDLNDFVPALLEANRLDDGLFTLPAWSAFAGFAFYLIGLHTSQFPTVLDQVVPRGGRRLGVQSGLRKGKLIVGLR